MFFTSLTSLNLICYVYVQDSILQLNPQINTPLNLALNKIAGLKSKIRFSLIVAAVINIVTTSLNLYPVVLCYTTYSGVLETPRKNIFL